ncbi:MAG: right-handed parallel beta-helix repeat-containing protein [Pseudomonadota bacterium]
MQTRNIAAVTCALCHAAGAGVAADLIASDPASLRSALVSAAPGDRVLVAAGNYGAFSLSDAHFLPSISLSPADPDAPPVFTSIYFSDVSGLSLSDVKVVYGQTQAPLSSYAVNILRGADLDFSKMEIVSAADGNAGNDAYGVNIRNSARITLRENLIHDVYRGAAVFDSDDIEISRNVILAAGSDGVVARGSVGLSVLDNYFADFGIIDIEVQHPDAIQLWSREAPRANADVVIRGNLIRRGKGDATQGIFIKTPEIATRNLLIEHNVIEQSMAQGIAVENGEGVIIRNNTVIPDDYELDNPGVEIRAPFANVSVEANISMAYRLPAGATSSANVTADYFNPWIASFIGAHLAAPAGPSGPADYAPLGAAGARNYVRDLWAGDPSAPSGTLTPAAAIADLAFADGVADSASDPVPVTLVSVASGGAYYASDPSPKLSAAPSIALDARARLPDAAAGWRLLAAVPNSYDLRIDRSRIRFSVWTAAGVTRLDGVGGALLDLAAHNIRAAYDGVAGTMSITLDGVEIAHGAAPVGPIAYNPTQRLYIAGAPWGLLFGDGVERLKISR